jgi:hypothetical protein
LPSAIRDHQKRVKPLFLVASDPRRQQSPKPAVGARSDPGNGSLKDARSRQQHFVRHQPSRRPVEQGTWPVGARPTQRVKPAKQPPLRRRLSKKPVAVSLANFDGVVTSSLARRISNQEFGTGDVELSCQDFDGAGWCFGRIVEECTEKADSAELYGEAQAHVIATAPANQIPVSVIQMKIARKLFR